MRGEKYKLRKRILHIQGSEPIWWAENKYKYKRVSETKYELLVKLILRKSYYNTKYVH